MFKSEKLIENKSGKAEQKKWKFIIPGHEFVIHFSRSEGPGGQNVNKRETKVTLVWKIEQSHVLTEEQKQKIIFVYANKINQGGEFIIYSQKSRSQEQNRQDVIKRLQQFVNLALKPVKKRIPTKPSQSAIEKRLTEKKKKSKKKKLRQNIKYLED